MDDASNRTDPQPEQPESTEPAGPTLQPLTAEQIEQASEFFRTRLVGQPEAVKALTNVLYRQSARLKRILEHPNQPGVLPNDPSVLLFAGGSWGKSLAANLISQALAPQGLAPFALLTPLPQDIEGNLDVDPRVFMVPFAVILVEHLETAWAMNRRFVANVAQLIDAGIFPVRDPKSGSVTPVSLGLSTFIFTTSIGEDEIRRVLHPSGQIGFLRRDDISPEEAYESICQIVDRELQNLPPEILDHIDETVVFRPLTDADLRSVFDAEIDFYEASAFPGKNLRLDIESAARELIFAEAVKNLDMYGTHTLRGALQRYIDPPVYRAYVKGELSEDALETKAVQVALNGKSVQVALVDRAG